MGFMYEQAFRDEVHARRKLVNLYEPVGVTLDSGTLRTYAMNPPYFHSLVANADHNSPGV